MSDAYSTDWAAIGLPDHSPFAVLARPRAEPQHHKVAQKRGPKMTLASREKVLRDNSSKSISISKPADADKTTRIKRGTL